MSKYWTEDELTTLVTSFSDIAASDISLREIADILSGTLTDRSPESIRKKLMSLQTSGELEELINQTSEMSDSKISSKEFVDYIDRRCVSLPSRPFPVPSERPRNPVVVNILMGDTQYGMSFTERDTYGLNKYDSKEFTNRLKVYMSQLNDALHSIAASRDIVSVSISFLGDMVEGFGIFRGQQNFLDKKISDQVFDMGDIMAELVMWLAERVPKVYAHCVSGNHGRMSKDHHPNDNFDNMAYKIMQRRVENQENVNVYIYDKVGVYRIPEASNFTWLISHGEEVPFNSGRPANSATKKADNYKAITNVGVNYVCFGHLHKEASVSIPYGKVYINGSWIGGHPLVLSRANDITSASQTILVVDPDDGVIQEHTLMLSRPKELLPDDELILVPYE